MKDSFLAFFSDFSNIANICSILGFIVSVATFVVASGTRKAVATYKKRADCLNSLSFLKGIKKSIRADNADMDKAFAENCRCAVRRVKNLHRRTLSRDLLNSIENLDSMLEEFERKLRTGDQTDIEGLQDKIKIGVSDVCDFLEKEEGVL